MFVFLAVGAATAVPQHSKWNPLFKSILPPNNQMTIIGSLKVDWQQFLVFVGVHKSFNVFGSFFLFDVFSNYRRSTKRFPFASKRGNELGATDSTSTRKPSLIGSDSLIAEMVLAVVSALHSNSILS